MIDFFYVIFNPNYKMEFPTHDCYFSYVPKIKLPFRMVIYLLKFFSLKIENVYVDCKKNEIVKDNGGFKMKDIFGYFKLDKFRKIFKLYEYLDISDSCINYNASFIVSIKIKPVIIGYVITCVNEYHNDEYNINDKICEVCSIMSMEWMYILTLYCRPTIRLSRRNLKPSNIKTIVILSFSSRIYLGDYPKLEFLQLDYNKNDSGNCYDWIEIYGYDKWNGILESNTPEYLYYIE